MVVMPHNTSDEYSRLAKVFSNRRCMAPRDKL